MDDEMREAPRPAVQRHLFTAPRQISRPKPPVQQEEELGAEPKLGDFENVHALSISEARAVIFAVHEKRTQRPAGENPLGPGRAHNDSQTINQFVEYLEEFARYKDHERLHALSGVMDTAPQLTSVEKAMIASLSCDTADEAKTLIPSLVNKIDDEELDALLEDMRKLRQS